MPKSELCHMCNRPTDGCRVLYYGHPEYGPETAPICGYCLIRYERYEAEQKRKAQTAL